MAKQIIRLTESKLCELIKEGVTEALKLNEHIDEGIDFDPKTKQVSYNPSHETNVDTSIENNPEKDNSIVPNVNVWSIFKRKRGNVGEGNPLIYALKGEGWKFRSDEDRKAIEKQFHIIADKFASLYPIGVTILIPSGSYLKDYIARVVMSKSENAQLIEGIILKMTTEEVANIILYDDNCKFRQIYKNNFNSAFVQLGEYLEHMDKEREGYFSRHLVFNDKMRDVIDMTLKASDDSYARFAKKINGQNVLIIDDPISREQSIQNVCNIIKESYAPRSITVFTLLSN